MLKKYNDFTKSLNEKMEVLNESSPRIPNSEDYWKKKGKYGKKVALYFHDDLDGIYSAIAMKGYLEKKGFEIMSFGLVNYQEGWTSTELNPDYINIALDYAENVEGIDVYMDHHGEFQEGENKDQHSVKTHTTSAYEGIMDQLGLPVDSSVLDTIIMVDSAKYDQYEIDIKEIITFDLKNFKSKLEFAAAFNQLLKRSDHKTFIEVVANSKDMAPSIYNIFKMFRLLYPANNLDNMKMKKLAKEMDFIGDDGKPDVKELIDYINKTNPKMIRDFEKDFVTDAQWRLGQMQSRTRGSKQIGAKGYIDSQAKFKEMFVREGRGGNDKVEMPGYQIIGNMCFVPSGTWANALRARAILERDLLDDNRIPIIEYRVMKNSPLYSELLNKNGQSLELVGDIGDFRTKDKKFVTFSPKEDVTDESSTEGIKGVVEVSGEHVIFRAKQPIFWILLQYGNTMQVASLHSMAGYVKEYLPEVDGKKIENLGGYCDELLTRMAKDFGYNALTIPEMATKSGGHPGIGSVSNIFGSVRQNIIKVPNPKNPKENLETSSAYDKNSKEYNGVRFLDLIKNTMISELSGVKFDDVKMPWGDPDERPASKPSASEMNKKVMMSDQIRKSQNVQKTYSDWEAQDKAQRNAKLK